MPAVKSSLVHPAYKTEYRVRNRRQYDQGPRSRGDVTIRFSEEATANWIPKSTGRRGGQRLYWDLAIETSLTLRTVFRLALRQTEGFVGAGHCTRRRRTAAATARTGPTTSARSTRGSAYARVRRTRRRSVRRESRGLRGGQFRDSPGRPGCSNSLSPHGERSSCGDTRREGLASQVVGCRVGTAFAKRWRRRRGWR